MPDVAEWKIDVAGRLGKRVFKDFMKYCGEVRRHKPLAGEEQKVLRSIGELTTYLLDQYATYRQWVAEERYVFCKGRTAEELLLERVLQYRWHVLTDLGLLQAFATGDFSHLYRGLMLCVRYYYASEIYLELLRGRGYSTDSGVDHGAYEELVLACFALKRPDWARRFFPKELGLVRRAHSTTKHLSNLIIGLLHEQEEWREKAAAAARAYLRGKRQVAERAAISCLLHIYEDDADGMSEDLQILMDTYRRATWLMGAAGGTANTVSLYSLYLMGGYYLSENAFLRVRRPSGPGWWNEYVDLCLWEPLPAGLDKPFVVFPEPLGFFNEALSSIDKEPPPGSVRLALDICKVPLN